MVVMSGDQRKGKAREEIVYLNRDTNLIRDWVNRNGKSSGLHEVRWP
jgi:hypothetical protein